ncbi:GAF domain-containing protein, partial [Actinomadura logoneensis]
MTVTERPSPRDAGADDPRENGLATAGATAAGEAAASEVPAGERERLVALRRYRVLDTPPDGALDKIASLAARIFGAPMATVSFVDGDRVWFKAAHGLGGIEQTGREPGLWASAVLHDGPYVVTDAAADPRTAGHPFVRGDLGVRSYAAARITTAEGHGLGTVDVLDVRPRRPTADQLQALQELAALVMDELEARLAALRVVAAERRRRADAERLARTLQRTL